MPRSPNKLLGVQFCKSHSEVGRRVGMAVMASLPQIESMDFRPEIPQCARTGTGHLVERAISMKSLAAAGAARLEPHKSNYATIPRFLARPIGAWSSVRPTLPLRGMSGSRKSGEMPGSCTRPGASAMSRPPTARPRNLAGQEFGLALVTGLMPEGLRPLLFVWAAFRNERPEKCKSGIESSENT